MPIDMYQSKRGYNMFCKWWSRSEEDEYTSDELIMKRVPSGTFFAKEVAPEVSTTEAVGDTFMFEKNNITIKSPDNLIGIKKNDLVLYNGEVWFVENVQKPISKMQNTFFSSDKHCSHHWYIELRK